MMKIREVGERLRTQGTGDYEHRFAEHEHEREREHEHDTEPKTTPEPEKCLCASVGGADGSREPNPAPSCAPRDTT